LLGGTVSDGVASECCEENSEYPAMISLSDYELAAFAIPSRCLVATPAAKPKSLARNNKTRMECSGSSNPAGDSDCLAMEMPTPPKRSSSARVASLP
jgi:hypothetical protein